MRSDQLSYLAIFKCGAKIIQIFILAKLFRKNKCHTIKLCGTAFAATLGKAST